MIVDTILTFVISLPLRLFMSGMRAAILSDKICVKFLTPICLLVVLPVIFYLYVWAPLAWIFFGWMLLYFILRRVTGVSEEHKKIDKENEEYGEYLRKLEELDKQVGKGSDKETD
jgi:hypothetical protein